MYTGTLIRDLLATVERAEQGVRRKQLADERELQIIFGSQNPLLRDEPDFVGAA
jgi:hypothetical protein